MLCSRRPRELPQEGRRAGGQNRIRVDAPAPRPTGGAPTLRGGPAPLRWEALVIRRARAVVGAVRPGRPPVRLEQYAGRGGLPHRDEIPSVRWPPHTPQWNGAVAIALARALLPPGVSGPAADTLAEVGAAELLLPMHLFRPIAARTDLTMDGVRGLAMRFAAPIRLTVRQWLRTGMWRGCALLWRSEGGTLRLRWRAASAGMRFPRTMALGAPADAVWAGESRLYPTHRTGRPHHGVEEVLTGAGSVWWFTRFGAVRDDEGTARSSARAVLALVTLARER